MHNRLNHYLQNNNILIPKLFGFRKGNSIDDVAFKVTDSVSKCINQRIQGGKNL
jgi:hypothetical protein